MPNNIPDLDLFMMCGAPDKQAYASLPDGFTFDLCRRSELSTWMAFPFDEEKLALEQKPYMTKYFQDVYGAQEDLFFSKCLFVRNSAGEPVGTCFIWKAYGQVSTLHWFKVKKEYEGKGIGRAILTKLLNDLTEADYPLYLHTQPGSYRAIKLYTDFGFDLITDDRVGARENGLNACLPVLKEYMPASAFQALRFRTAPEEFLQAAASSEINEF